MEGFPIDSIKDVNSRPIVVFEKVGPIGWQAAQTTDLRGNVMSNRDGTDLKGAKTCQKEGDRGERMIGVSQE